MNIYKAVVLFIGLLSLEVAKAEDVDRGEKSNFLLIENITGEASGKSASTQFDGKSLESPVNLLVPPSNDDLCGAIPLTVGAPCVGYAYTTIDATEEPDENYCSDTPDKSVWFSFVSPESGTVYITTTREFPGSISLTRMLYEEDGPFDCTDLTTIIDIGCNEDSYWPDTLAVCGLGAGITYYIQIYGWPAPHESNFCIEVIEDTPEAGPDQILCDQTSTTLAGSENIYFPHEWEIIAGPGTIESNLGTSNVNDLLPGPPVTIRRVLYCGEAIVAADTMMITNYAAPDDPDAGPDQELCEDVTTVLSGNLAEIGDPLWTILSGTAILSDPAIPEPDVSGLVIGETVTLEYSLTNGTCVKRDTMMITVFEMPMAIAGDDQWLCEQYTTTMNATEPLVGSGMWSVGGGSATFTNPSSPTSEVTGLAPAFSFASLHWTVTNGTCEDVASTFIVVDEYPLAYAGPDQQLCDESSTVMSADPPACSEGQCEEGLWTLIGGSATIADVTFEYTEITDMLPGTTVTLEWTVTNISGYCTSSDTVEIIIDEMPLAIAGDDQGLCEESTTTLDATPPDVGTGMWSVSGGIADITDPSSPTSGVTGLAPAYSFAYLLWTVTNGSCADYSGMSIIVDAFPGVSAGADQELCDETVTVLDGSEPLDFGKSFESGLWTIISGSATIADPTLFNSGVSNLIPGTTVELVWTITSESDICAASDTMTITVYEVPSTADAGPDQVLCASEAMTTLEGNTPLAGTGMWTIIDGIATITDPTSPTTTVTNIDTDVLLILQWTISNGICPSSMDEVVISFDEEPTIADAGPDQELCEETTTFLSANTPLVGTGQWFVEEGIATITDPTSPTSEVTDMVPGIPVLLIWEISNGVCFESYDDVFIYIDENPTTADAGPDQNLCGVTSTFVDANEPVVGYGLWTVVSGTATIDNAESPTTEVTDLVIGASVTLEWTIENGSCPASIDQVVITIDESPSIADAGPDQELCDETETTLSGNMPDVGSGMWSVVAGTATLIDPASPTSGVTGLIPGESVLLEWSIENGICPASTDQIEIYIYEIPSIADAGDDQELCDEISTVVNANAPDVGTGLWSVVSGDAIIDNPESPSTAVSGLEVGSSVVLEWTISNGSCPPSVDQITIFVDELPTVADAGPDQELCNTASTFLEGNIPEVGSGLWTIIDGTGFLSDPESPNTEITDLVAGTSVTLEWTIENGVCPASIDQIVITVYELPTIADAGDDQQICNLTETMLSANATDVGTGLWTVVDGDADITDPESPTSAVTGLIPGTSVILQWEIVNGVCPVSNDQMTIVIDELPSSANAGSDQFLCDELSTFLEADEPLIGNGVWTILDGVATIVSPNDPQSEVTGLVYGTTVSLEWTITNETCPATVDHVIIDVEELPTEADAGPDQNLCGPTSTFLEGNMPLVGEGYWLKISGPGTIVNPEAPNSELTGLEVGIPTICQWTIFGVNCPASSDNVSIETFPGSIESDAGPDQQICNETSVFLQGNQEMGAVGEWTIIMGTATIIDPSDPNTEVTGFVQGETVVLQWALTPDGCSPSVDQMSIFVNTSGFVDAGADQHLCDEPSTTLSANTPDSGDGLWSVISGSATIVSPSDPLSNVIDLVPNTTVVLEWTITDGDCLPSKDTMQITISTLPSMAMAGDDQALCDNATTFLNADAPLIGTGMWSVVSGIGTIVDPASPNSEINNLISGESLVLQWTVTNGACPANQDTAEIFVDMAPTQAIAGEDQILCVETETILAGNLPDIGTGMWSIISGNAQIENPLLPATNVTGLVPGSNVSLVWSVTNGACPPSTDTINILWHEMPSIAEAGVDQFLCKETSTMLEAVNPIVGEGFWTVISGIGTLSDPLLPNTLLTDLVENDSVTLHWTVTNATCPPSIDEVTIHVDVFPSPSQGGPDFLLCNETNLNLNATSPAIGIGSWSVISGSAAILEPTSPNSMVEELIPGATALLVWTVENGACNASYDTIFIQVDAAPSIAMAGNDQIVCGEDFTFLEAIEATSGQGMWTVESGMATIADPASPTTQVSDLVIGSSVTLKWTISNGSCPPTSDEVVIETGNSPTEASAGIDQTLCEENETAINANTPVVGTGEWKVISGSGMISDPSSPDAMVTGLVFGEPFIVQWVITEGNCLSSDTLTIFADQFPTLAEAGEDQELCTTETTLEAINPVIGTGEWSIVFGSADIADINSPETFISNIPAGTTVVLRWTVFNTCGETSDEVSISVNSEMPLASAGDDQVLCNAFNATMAALPANVGIGTWTIVSGPGTVDNPTSESTLVSDLVPGTTTILRWTVESAPCSPSFDDVMIQVDELPVNVSAGTDETICASDYILSAGDPLIGSGEWMILEGSGMLGDALNPNSTISGIPQGTQITLSWNVSNGVCPSVADTVIISTTLPLTAPDAGGNEVYCNLPFIILDGNLPDPGQGMGTWTLLSGSGTIEDSSDPNTKVTNPGLGDNVFVWTISNGYCPSLSDTVTVTNSGGQGLNANFLVNQIGCVDTLMYMFDISENETEPTAYLWDFGDNTTSTERDPVHQYTAVGDYTITLTTYLDDCASVPASKDIRVFACLFNENESPGTSQILLANVYPNPTQDDFNVSLKLKEENDVELTMYNVNGQLVARKEFEKAKEILASLASEAPGFYLIRIKVRDEVIIFKALKVN